jgi:hypothetical protein
MIEHWYDYLPAAWYTEGRWYVLLTVLLLMALSFAAGWWLRGRRK